MPGQVAGKVGQRRPGKVRAAEPLPAQSHALGDDKAAPDAVLADIPVPQRQLQALGAYRAGQADVDSARGFAAGYFLVRTDWKPCVGIKGSVSAPRLAGHCLP
jgi:hypothetical protein